MKARRRSAVGGAALVLIGLVMAFSSRSPQLPGAVLALGLATVAFALAPRGSPSPDLRVDQRTPCSCHPQPVPRRTLLAGLAATGAGALGLGGAIWALSDGYRRALRRTAWAAGVRLVTEDARPIRVDDVPLGGLVTAFPQGAVDAADSPLVLIRLHPSLIRPEPDRVGWAEDGCLAYSKICTHAGCPVGLYEAERHELLCPCHQSAFDVLHAARPTFGPAAAPLPQLPLGVDGDGYLVALGDLSAPPGPAFWSRG